MTSGKKMRNKKYEIQTHSTSIKERWLFRYWMTTNQNVYKLSENWDLSNKIWIDRGIGT